MLDSPPPPELQELVLCFVTSTHTVMSIDQRAQAVTAADDDAVGCSEPLGVLGFKLPLARLAKGNHLATRRKPVAGSKADEMHMYKVEASLKLALR